jgi:hypothetical protein
MMHNKLATPTLSVSLVGCFLLFTGDFCFGVFANIPSQLYILVFLVVVALTLLRIARRVDAMAAPIEPDSTFQPTNLNHLKHETTMQYTLMLNETA